jgi:mono/diheme cytochrome c family protein
MTKATNCLAAISLALFAALSGCGGGSANTSAETGNDGGTGGGPAVFVSVCSPCHGKQAEGTALGPEIRHPDRNFATWIVRSGRDGKGFPAPMVAYAASAVSDADLGGILNWLWQFPEATDGKGLYLDHCGNCHGADGSGGVVGQSALGKRITELEQKVRGGQGGSSFALRTKFMPAIDSTQLSAAELTLIEQFLNAR